MKLEYFFVLVISSIISFCSFSCEKKNVEAPYALTISEGFINPIGFYDSRPTLSWKLPVSEQVKSQTAYQVVLASSEELLPNNPDLWDSNKQDSEQVSFVKYQGKVLESRQKVYWQVRYWNENGKVSEWSEANTFELGLLHNIDWKAKWTGLDTAKDSIKGVRKFLMHKPQYLSKGFTLPNKKFISGIDSRSTSYLVYHCIASGNKENLTLNQWIKIR